MNIWESLNKLIYTSLDKSHLWTMANSLVTALGFSEGLSQKQRLAMFWKYVICTDESMHCLKMREYSLRFKRVYDCA